MPSSVSSASAAYTVPRLISGTVADGAGVHLVGGEVLGRGARERTEDRPPLRGHTQSPGAQERAGIALRDSDV